MYNIKSKNKIKYVCKNKNVFLVEYLLQDATINTDRFCQIVTKLCLAIKRKHLGLLSRKVLLFHRMIVLIPFNKQKTAETLQMEGFLSSTVFSRFDTERLLLVTLGLHFK